jgi:hypothetical protein
VWDVLILLLLWLPADVQWVSDQQSAEVWDALKRVSINLQLADRREHWNTHFRQELRCIRGRFRDMHAMPLVEEGDWLPPVKYAYEMAAMAESACYRFDQMAALEPYREIQWGEAAREAEAAAEVWRYASWAADPQGYVFTRRPALARLRDIMGERWPSRTLPCPVPLWALRRLD